MLYLFQRHYLRCTYSIIKQQKNHFTTKSEFKVITTTISNAINDNNTTIDPVLLNNHNDHINSFPSIKTTTTTNISNLNKNENKDRKETIIKNKNNSNHNDNNSNNKKIDSNRSLIFQRCSGITHKDGKRCSRKVPVQINQHSSNNLYYCHNHRSQSPFIIQENNMNNNEIMNDSPIIERMTSIQTPSVDDCWSLWITDRIKSKRGKQLIQKEMMKPLSDQDEGGYIYCYILTDGPRASTDKYCYFKIGRSTNPTRRMVQFINKCHHTPSVLDILPNGKFQPRNYHHHHHQPLNKRKKNNISKNNKITFCPFSHRIEKLIHLELSYLYPHPYSFECSGCGQIHREWIRVPRPTIFNKKNKESIQKMSDYQVYLEKIRPIVLHWIQYGVSIDLAARFYFTHSQLQISD